MGWNVDTAIQAQNVVAQISTRLQANGWTLYDNVAGAPVHTATNNQGVAMYLQVSQSGSYTYIQFRGWQSWNSVSHVGTNGSSVSYSRMYLGGSPLGATTTVDIYSSVTSNRAIFAINSQTTNYRSWQYAGGLDSVAGTNDPNCYVLISGYEFAGVSNSFGQILGSSGGYSANWGSCNWVLPCLVGTGNTALSNLAVWSSQGVNSDSGKVILFPILCIDFAAYATGFGTGIGPTAIRGNLDGLLFCPLGNGANIVATGSGFLAHLDTVTIGATTYLVWQPGGTPTANVFPWTGNYVQGLAISET